MRPLLTANGSGSEGASADTVSIGAGTSVMLTAKSGLVALRQHYSATGRLAGGGWGFQGSTLDLDDGIRGGGTAMR